jgi:hypothetical protein
MKAMNPYWTGKNYQKHYTDSAELLIACLFESPKIKVALKLMQEAFDKEEGTRRKVMFPRP